MRIVIDRDQVWERALAIDETGEVCDLYADRVDRPLLYGGIYQGKVIRRLPQKAGALIDIGGCRTVWQAGSEFDRSRRQGDTLIVQVVRDGTRDKSPRVTCDIRLIGQFAIFMPLTCGVWVSRRYQGQASCETIAALKAVARGGWIVRSSATDLESVVKDGERLVDLWRKATPRGAEPCQLFPPHGAAISAILDAPRITALEVSSIEDYRSLNAWMKVWRPDVTSTIEVIPDLWSDDFEALFASLITPTVPLPCGGSMDIESTKALIAIDVNLGSSRSLMDTNLNAAREIPRQIRLRNLSGTLLIDFIRLRSHGQRRLIEQSLRDSLASDSRTHVYGWTKLGLFEITRESRRHSLIDML